MFRKTSLLILLLSCLGLAAFAPGVSRHGVAPASADSTAGAEVLPYLVLPSTPIQATDEFLWNIRIRVVNHMDEGIYVDSLSLLVEDDYAGSRRRGQTWTFNVPSVATILPTVSSHDSGFVTFQGQSYSERANVKMRLHCHTAKGRKIVTPEATVMMAPAPVSLRFPPIWIETKKGKIEHSLVTEVWPGRPSPGVLLIHGEDGQSRDWMPMAWHLANNGFSCMLMSLPGYGLSTGPADFAGPRSIEAVNLVLDRLRRGSNIDSTRLAIWGISEGATVAALVAAKRKDLGAVVLQSGVYDLLEASRVTESKEFQRILEAEAGPKSGWKARSPLLAGVRPAAPTLILHGGDDRVVPVEQAKAYQAFLKGKGGKVVLEVFPNDGHRLPMVANRDTVLSFLRSRLNPPDPRP